MHDDHTYAQQLDEYARVLCLFDSLNRNSVNAHMRIDLLVERLGGFADAEDRQDDALTWLESRVLDLERQNAELWQALAGFRQLGERVEKMAACLARNNLWFR